ncbi:MAG: methionine--tRNA ligase [Candidatus Yanofskybacteria bacterium RIFCSPLOWO2_02_FULL_43_10]|uniref:Methionine--tRNA ligase n=1 Tax=Candidatus Yanofskybacteria bacterium RIFCSPLOWO2_12_FULL_43_11b TaxID=1802710 RepID=A0A1F8H9M5_9BACT|nr:MAG: methionine--tRNA ligase [Candidatus Yanofskybacteria bacterium RIFCSPHIGHO2_01_FULL_43_32]OGN11452.1 MAG: methionine--tRNA ligase [Candidatus Yanofskybacteria bacterium RIFCSPHIGHO2_02_FULL_43_12]OGN17477.1 MAG: methionine--tRNA ligase [Candidatus Yanofskybacteria bacterium RIFCSPHIGHO2_12_FULL_43_11]OGN24931.1 MAG: methionine--tRNA ligase [Candidatus Yanofskybacteria bacterium RIFCSPLOWO2_01_FULL_43_46]OGN30694.1 MAG: methionine--tRNA ligase [Candidatus Yanofskybacteria bacterium RIFCS
MKNKFYITTAIAYTNGPPHIGHALEFLQVDVLARYHRIMGDDTYFLTGTDEHGATVVKAAEKNGKDVKVFVDEMAEKFKELTRAYNVSNDDFIRTSDQVRHWPAARKIWNLIKDDLYKKNYQGLYCIGHEAFMKKSDLVDGVCPLHKTEPEKIEEENWFFKLTKYKKEVKKKIESGELKIIPETRKQEILNLIDDAEDVSFSRPSKDLKWGIPVPNDETQTMYVWADALTNYISALGYAEENPKFEKYWPADVHLVGKDILRFHAMIWPAMLLSAGLPLPKAIYVHGFITVDGEKMSKTVGNVVDPFEAVKKYSAEVVRYFLLREIPSGDDGDFSYKKLEERYNGDLANGLGNLVQRVATLIENNLDNELIWDKNNLDEIGKKTVEVWFSVTGHTYIRQFELHRSLDKIWEIISGANGYVDERKPWVEAKENPKKFLETMTVLVAMIHHISWLLQPFMPETADKIAKIFGADLSNKEITENYKFIVRKSEGLFPRLK